MIVEDVFFFIERGAGTVKQNSWQVIFAWRLLDHFFSNVSVEASTSLSVEASSCQSVEASSCLSEGASS